MNWADIVVLIILGISVLTAYKNGFVKTCFDFFSTIVSLILAYKLYPTSSAWLRSTGWFSTIKSSVESTINIKEVVSDMTLSAQTSLINSLELPNFLKTALLKNNNTEVYGMLNVSQIEDYISSYIANICINVVAMVGTFLVVLIIIKIIAGVIDLVAKLPVLNFFNKTAGAILGLAKGVIIIWIVCMVITFFYSKPALQPILLAIQQSTIAKFFYNNNMIIFMVTQIFI